MSSEHPKLSVAGVRTGTTGQTHHGVVSEHWDTGAARQSKLQEAKGAESDHCFWACWEDILYVVHVPNYFL